MNSDREIKDFETKNGHKVRMYTYITGGEMRQIQDVYLEKAEVSLSGKDVSFSGITGDLASKAQDKTFELLIVEIDGSSENVVKSVADMRVEDYDEVVKALNEITNIKKTESDTSTRS